jgi:hypothetical protein
VALATTPYSEFHERIPGFQGNVLWSQQPLDGSTAVAFSPPTPEPALRHAVRAEELKVAGVDWTNPLANETENTRAGLAAELLANTGAASTGARVQAFIERDGGCRATFDDCRHKPGVSGQG